jgi:hypothetical protein
VPAHAEKLFAAGLTIGAKLLELFADLLAQRALFIIARLLFIAKLFEDRLLLRLRGGLQLLEEGFAVREIIVALLLEVFDHGVNGFRVVRRILVRAFSFGIGVGIRVALAFATIGRGRRGARGGATGGRSASRSPAGGRSACRRTTRRCTACRRATGGRATCRSTRSCPAGCRAGRGPGRSARGRTRRPAGRCTRGAAGRSSSRASRCRACRAAGGRAGCAASRRAGGRSRRRTGRCLSDEAGSSERCQRGEQEDAIEFFHNEVEGTGAVTPRLFALNVPDPAMRD